MGILDVVGRRIFRVPLTRARCESFQTRRGLRRALRAGFDETAIHEGKFFVATARKARRGSCES
jgi:hypothetical protein